MLFTAPQLSPPSPTSQGGLPTTTGTGGLSSCWGPRFSQGGRGSSWGSSRGGSHLLPLPPPLPTPRPHRTPRCPPVFRRPPCAGPRGTGTPVYPRTLAGREGGEGPGRLSLPAPCQPSQALTKPRLLVPLHLDGQAEVRQFHGRPLALAGQEQVLGLQKPQGSCRDPQGTEEQRVQMGGQAWPMWVSPGTADTCGPWACTHSPGAGTGASQGKAGSEGRWVPETQDGNWVLGQSECAPQALVGAPSPRGSSCPVSGCWETWRACLLGLGHLLQDSDPEAHRGMTKAPRPGSAGCLPAMRMAHRWARSASHSGSSTLAQLVPGRLLPSDRDLGPTPGRSLPTCFPLPPPTKVSAQSSRLLDSSPLTARCPPPASPPPQP